MKTFQVRGGDPDVMAWAREHNLDPHLMSRIVVIDDDGMVHLRRHLLRDGKRYIIGEEIASESVVVTPKRPFPYAPTGETQ